MHDPVDPVGTIFAGKYQLLERAGEGGMATVWRAVMRWAEGFFRQVAVKLLLPNLTAHAKVVQMFVEEARVGSQLQHPNIVQTLDFGREGIQFYLVLEWVDGLDLRRYAEAHRAAGQPTPWPLVAAVGIEVLRGLGAAHGRVDHWGHAAPVIHRDVTPQNILLGSNGVVKVADFGLSRAKDRARITDPSIVKGKLGYLSPEVAWGKPATPQSDLYCLALVLWEALTGTSIFQGNSDVEVFLKARAAEIPDLRGLRPDVPEQLTAVLERGLARDPAERYQSAHEMLRGLSDVLRHAGEPTDAPVIGASVVACRKALGLPPTSPLPEDLLSEAARSRVPPLPDER